MSFVVYLKDNKDCAVALDSDIDAPQVFRFEKIRETADFIMANMGRMRFQTDDNCEVHRRKVCGYSVFESGRDVTDEYAVIIARRSNQ